MQNIDLNNIPEISVSELSQHIKKCVESSFPLVRVKGEISGCKPASSGHIYLDLKDDGALINAVCWKGVAAKLPMRPENGLEVICLGKITTYSGSSRYQLVIEAMEVSGEGSILKMLEERKRKLQAEGLFAPERKKKIPFIPETIGVVTSPTGAVIRDIWHRVSERFPRTILLYPSAVQGEGAAEKIAAGVECFNNIPIDGYKNSQGQLIKRPDVIIVARGGGSLEDLLPFSEEVVVRAVANSEIPVISAVGHETDTMLIDYVADLRAPTPTGAAEKAVPVRLELLAYLQSLYSRKNNAVMRYVNDNKLKVESLSRGIPKLQNITDEYTQRLDERFERLNNAIKRKFIDASKNYEFLSARLEGGSFKKILSRGFSMVRDEGGNPLTSAKELQAKPTRIWLEFNDGAVSAITEPANKSTSKVNPKPKRKNNEQAQGSLF